jgi:predicted secreted hydrolase
MKSRLACIAAAVLLLQPLAAQYRTALPGYRYEFPRDHFNHPDFQTEWWYYTGNLKSADGRRFGFELTFFRQAVSRDPTKVAAWEVQDLYLAHLALSDLNGGKFYHAERTNRSGPGIAAVKESLGRIWNGNWQIQWHGSDQELRAVDERFQLHLTLHPEKTPVIHGEDGVSQKAEGPGRASHYVSLTRLATSGVIELGNEKFEVGGTSWMDHEFFTHQLEPSQTGWDWLSLQLEDHTEVMLFRIRRKDGSIDPYSAGTYVDANGKTTHLRSADFTLQPSGEIWKSPHTGARYPIHWRVVIPKLSIELEAKTPLESQELTGKTKLAPNYWEGAIVLTGQRKTQPLTGVGYLEMTGYDRPVQITP